jgi:hypothetical protein
LSRARRGPLKSGERRYAKENKTEEEGRAKPTGSLYYVLKAGGSGQESCLCARVEAIISQGDARKSQEAARKTPPQAGPGRSQREVQDMPGKFSERTGRSQWVGPGRTTDSPTATRRQSGRAGEKPLRGGDAEARGIGRAKPNNLKPEEFTLSQFSTK